MVRALHATRRKREIFTFTLSKKFIGQNDFSLKVSLAMITHLRSLC